MTDPVTRSSPAAPGHRVLVVDDEEPLARLVGAYLERQGFTVTLAFDGPAALGLARRTDPDVVVLDLGLPGLDGLEVCRRLRTFSDCYVVMLTARSEEADTLTGLSVGADDYVTKPFSPRELVARVIAMLRRPRAGSAGRGGDGRGGDGGDGGGTPGAEEAPPLEFGPLTIDVQAREARLGDAPVDLTRTEFDLLVALATHPRTAFSRRRLIEAVWGESWVGDEHLVDVHVGHVRRKLGDDASAPRFIRTVRGVGYRMGEGR